MAWKLTKVDNANHKYTAENDSGDSIDVTVPHEHAQSHEAKSAFIRSACEQFDAEQPEAEPVRIHEVIAPYVPTWIWVLIGLEAALIGAMAGTFLIQRG